MSLKTKSHFYLQYLLQGLIARHSTVALLQGIVQATGAGYFNQIIPMQLMRARSLPNQQEILYR